MELHAGGGNEHIERGGLFAGGARHAMVAQTQHACNSAAGGQFAGQCVYGGEWFFYRCALALGATAAGRCRQCAGIYCRRLAGCPTRGAGSKAYGAAAGYVLRRYGIGHCAVGAVGTCHAASGY